MAEGNRRPASDAGIAVCHGRCDLLVPNADVAHAAGGIDCVADRGDGAAYNTKAVLDTGGFQPLHD